MDERFPEKYWYEAVNEAQDLIDDRIETDIQGYDADAEVIRTARRNAEAAGVDHLIHFQQREVRGLSHPKNTDSLSQIRLTANGWRTGRHSRRSTGISARRSGSLTAGPLI